VGIFINEALPRTNYNRAFLAVKRAAKNTSTKKSRLNPSGLEGGGNVHLGRGEHG